MSDNEIYNLIDGTPPVLDLYKLYQGSLNVRKELDDIVRDAGYGSMSSVNYLTLRGFNFHRHGQPMVQTSRNNMGYTFFTRPILNLTYDNLRNVSQLVQLTTAPEKSMQRLVRATLDPWSHKGRYGRVQKLSEQDKIADLNSIRTPFVDEYNPFIPILSNTLISLTGWKDVAINSHVSKAGVNGEQWAMADGYHDVTGAFEMSSSFRNIAGDPISLLFSVWLKYMIACRHEYLMNPYPCFVEEREWDYNTRIYRFIMDPTKTYIQKYAATIAFPLSFPTGNTFNYSFDENYQRADAEISISWQCIGCEYNVPRLIYDFNTLVGEYCPGLVIQYEQCTPESLVVKHMDLWQKLKPEEKNRGLYFAIPLINFITNELEWWIRRSDWEQFVQRKSVNPAKYSYRQRLP